MKNEYKKVLIFVASLFVLSISLNLLERFLVPNMISVVSDFSNPYRSFFMDLSIIGIFFLVVMNATSFIFRNSNKLQLLQDSLFIIVILALVFSAAMLSLIGDVTVELMNSISLIAVSITGIILSAVSYTKRAKQ